MHLTRELLDHMAETHPEDVALTDQEHAITFSKLKGLVDGRSERLFDTSASAYGQHTANATSRQIVALCADHVGSLPLVTIPYGISKEDLSATLKVARLEVIVTDMMDKVWETANVFGPVISAVTPVKLCDRYVWKVTFRVDRSGAQIAEAEAKLLYRHGHQGQADQPHVTRYPTRII